jgi:hypothetical protein
LGNVVSVIAMKAFKRVTTDYDVMMNHTSEEGGEKSGLHSHLWLAFEVHSLLWRKLLKDVLPVR